MARTKAGPFRGVGGASVLRKLIGVGHCQTRKSIKAPTYYYILYTCLQGPRVDKLHKFDGGGALPIILMMAAGLSAASSSETRVHCRRDAYTRY